MTSDERRDKSRGFSLLEMMAVITFMLILATISLPYFQRSMVLAREARLREDLFTLRVQIDRFTADYHRPPASLEELVEKAYMGSIPRDPFTGSAETWMVDMAPPDLAEQLDPAVARASSPWLLHGQDGHATEAATAPPGIVDVHSGAAGSALNGTPYAEF